MTYFTDLLDAYLEAKNELNDAKKKHADRYDFGYFYYPLVQRFDSAKDDLNNEVKAMLKAREA